MKREATAIAYLLSLGMFMSVLMGVAVVAVPPIWWTPKQSHGWSKDTPKWCAQFPCYANRDRLLTRR
jgi:hypothetical protein